MPSKSILTLPFTGRVGERSSPGWGGFQSDQYLLQYTVQVVVNVAIPYAKHMKIISKQVIVSQFIFCDMRLGTMLAAINFDDEPAFETDEIDNEPINRRLSAKMMAV